MNSTKIVFILSLLMIISANGQSQSTYRSCYGFDCKEKKWSFSIFAGFSLLGPGNDLTHGMKDSGFGDPARGKPIQYPISKTGIVWNVEAMYNLSKVSGLQLTIGKTLHSSVEGLDRIGLGNYLRIRNDLWTASFDYVWRIRKGLDRISIGPVIARHQIRVDDPERYYTTTSFSNSSSVKPGFNLGYSYSLVQKKSWFLSFNVKYTWLPDATIGSYTQEHTVDAFYGEMVQVDPGLYTSTFQKTKVRLSTINFGINTGFKF